MDNLKIDSLGALREKIDPIAKLLGVDVSSQVFETISLAMVGATSVGKSKTINGLIGRDVCQVGHVGNTTSEAGWNPVFLTKNIQPDFNLLDLPGWGVSPRVDAQYEPILQENIPKAHAILWILKADALGTLAYDLQWISNVILPAINHDSSRIVIGLNQIETVYDSAMRETGELSSIQKNNINQKCQLIFQECQQVMPDLRPEQIQPYSAAQGYRLWDLLHALVSSAGDYGWILEFISKLKEPKKSS